MIKLRYKEDTNQWVSESGQVVDPGNGPFCLYDTQDKCWLGDDDGPVTYTDYGIARVASQVAGAQLRWKPGRIQVELYDPAPKRLKDKVDAVMGPEEALKKIEEGGLL